VSRNGGAPGLPADTVIRIVLASACSSICGTPGTMETVSTVGAGLAA